MNEQERFNRLQRLASDVVDTASTYAEYGNNYDMVIREYHDLVRDKVLPEAECPVWEEPDRYFTSIADVCSWWVAKLVLFVDQKESKRTYFVDDVEPVALGILECL